MRIRIPLAAAFTGAAALGFAPITGSANGLADARAMLAAGDDAAAISTLDVYLQANPKDTDARFARAIALARLKRNAEAITAFTELARDLPKLAQPYNNLAAVYAAQGDYPKAQAALQNALLRDPNSTGTRINLGDVYASLAETEYQRALALDGTNTAASSRVAAIADLRAGFQTASENQAPIASFPLASAQQPLAAPVPLPAPVAVSGKPAAPAVPAGKPVAPVDEKSLIAFLQLWSQAQSKGDLGQYVELYAKNFQPPAGMDRAKWLEQVHQRLETSRHSQITLKDLRWKAVSDGVLMQFQQELKSGATSDRSTRLLLVVPAADHGWRIVREG